MGMPGLSPVTADSKPDRKESSSDRLGPPLAGLELSPALPGMAGPGGKPLSCGRKHRSGPRTWAGWVLAVVLAGALNLFLFAVMPEMIRAVPKTWNGMNRSGPSRWCGLNDPNHRPGKAVPGTGTPEAPGDRCPRAGSEKDAQTAGPETIPALCPEPEVAPHGPFPGDAAPGILCHGCAAAQGPVSGP